MHDPFDDKKPLFYHVQQLNTVGTVVGLFLNHLSIHPI